MQSVQAGLNGQKAPICRCTGKWHVRSWSSSLTAYRAAGSRDAVLPQRGEFASASVFLSVPAWRAAEKMHAGIVHRRKLCVASNDSQSEVEIEQTKESLPPRLSQRRQADSTDWVASNLTRRFGLAGGLVWLGILTFGVVSEQIKTRLEESAERKNTKDVREEKVITTKSGLKYADVRIGGGTPVNQGMLVILDYRATANGTEFEDTKKRGKPIVFRYGSRPFTGGLCQGVEEALASMRSGGVRKVTVPPELGFGEQGTVLRPTEHVPTKQGIVPPGATLEYELSLVRVSIPPS